MRTHGSRALARLSKTQQQIGLHLDVSREIVAKWLSGERSPGLPNRKLIQETYGITIESWDQEIEHLSEPKPSGDLWGDSSALSRVDRLERIVDAQLQSVETDAEMTPLERSKVSAELARTLNAIRRLKGEEVSEIKVLKHPKWQAIRDAVLEELQDDPERLERILERLEEYERRSA